MVVETTTPPISSQRSSVHLNAQVGNNFTITTTPININNNSSSPIMNNSGYEIPITDLILKATSKLNDNGFNRECVIVGDGKTV